MPPATAAKVLDPAPGPRLDPHKKARLLESYDRKTKSGIKTTPEEQDAARERHFAARKAKKSSAETELAKLRAKALASQKLAQEKKTPERAKQIAEYKKQQKAKADARLAERAAQRSGPALKKPTPEETAKMKARKQRLREMEAEPPKKPSPSQKNGPRTSQKTNSKEGQASGPGRCGMDGPRKAAGIPPNRH